MKRPGRRSLSPLLTVAKEQEHISKVGRERFARVLDLAMVEVKRDRHFIGMDKIRRQIAFEVALRVTRYPYRPLILPKGAGKANEEVQGLAEGLIEQATQNIREKPPA